MQNRRLATWLNEVEMAKNALLAFEAVDKKEQKEQENAKLREFLQAPFLE